MDISLIVIPSLLNLQHIVIFHDRVITVALFIFVIHINFLEPIMGYFVLSCDLPKQYIVYVTCQMRIYWVK